VVVAPLWAKVREGRKRLNIANDQKVLCSLDICEGEEDVTSSGGTGMRPIVVIRL
jgi:hypothetical protein